MSIKTNCYSLRMSRQFSSSRRYYERRVTSDEGGFAIYYIYFYRQFVRQNRNRIYAIRQQRVEGGKAALLAHLKPRLAFR